MAKHLHPNDEQLLALADQALGEDDEEVWKDRSATLQRRREWTQQASAVAQLIRTEKEAAVKVVSELITGPSAWWRKRVQQTEGTRTLGFVRTLLERAEKLANRSPADAVEATSIAVEIAEELRVDAYPFDMVITLRAEASRELAYSLYYVGRFPEALQAVERAENLFEHLPLEVVDLARTWLTRAAIYRVTDRQPEGIALCRRAADVFLSFGLRDRYVRARLFEAPMLHQLGRTAEALEVWRAIENEPVLRRDSSFGMLLHNVGSVYHESGELELAEQYLTRALEEYERLDNETEKVRTRWSIGSTLVAAGKLREALPLLRETSLAGSATAGSGTLPGRPAGRWRSSIQPGSRCRT